MIAAGLLQVAGRSERLAVERAVLAALDGLLRASGGYLEELGQYAGEFVGDAESVLTRLRGQAPAILVSTGDGDYDLKAMSRRRGVVALDLEIHIVSAHLRDREARRLGDEAGVQGSGDPGIYAILADVRDRLMGAELGIPGVMPPIAKTEEAVISLPTVSVFRATYSVRCSVEAQPPAGMPTRPAETVETRINLPDSPEVSPVVTAETTPDA